jgi:hypothetical protein
MTLNTSATITNLDLFSPDAFREIARNADMALEKAS